MAFKTLLTQLAKFKHARASNNTLPIKGLALRPNADISFEWSERLELALMDALHKQSQVRLLICDPQTLNYDTFISALVSLNKANNTLVLDTPKPLDYHRLFHCKESSCEVKLEIKTAYGLCHIEARVSQLFSHSRQQLEIHLSPTHANESADRRLYPRVGFNTLQAPRVKLQAKGQRSISTSLMDLSRQGMKCVFQGKDIRAELVSHALSQAHNPAIIDVELMFNEHFTVAVQAQIVQTQYLRSPSCHNVIRLKFLHCKPVDYAQLDEFIFYSEDSDLNFAA